MSFSSDIITSSINNTSLTQLVTESKFNEGVTSTIETIIESSTKSIINQVQYPTDVPTEIKYIDDTYITTEVYVPTTTESIALTADKLTPHITETITTPLESTTAIIIQESKPIETLMISSSSNTYNDQPATNSNTSYHSDPIDNNATVDNISIALIAGIIIASMIVLIALVLLCVILKRKRKNHYNSRRISPIMYLPTNNNASSSKHSLNTSISYNNKSVKDDTSFYVQSANYLSSTVSISSIDKPEKIYCNNTSNVMVTNATPLFPPIHRSNQIYNSSNIIQKELNNYSRESNQTMRSDIYRPSLHDSILIGSITTRQNSTCSSYQQLCQAISLYSNEREQHKMSLWDDALIDAWSTEDKQLVINS